MGKKGEEMRARHEGFSKKGKLKLFKVTAGKAENL